MSKQTFTPYTRRRGLLPAVVAAVLLSTGSIIAGAQPVAVIYYQVTYANGTVRDLDDPPQTNQGIRSVLRIARFEQDRRGYQVLTTEGPALRTVNAGRTEKVQLRWNGSAWAAPPVGGNRSDRPEPATQPDPLQLEIARIQAVLENLRDKLIQEDHAVAEARRRRETAADKQARAAAEESLDQAQVRRKDLLETIRRYETTLRALRSIKEPAQGQVRTLDKAPVDETPASHRAAGRRRTLPGQVCVHKLPPGRDKRTYRVSARHDEAGWSGAFYFVAYADTDADGKPDKLIARSPLACAQQPGRWSQWSFTTSYPQVYVGRAFASPTAGLYGIETPTGGQPDQRGQRGSAGGGTTEVYVSPYLGIVPNEQYKWWPYLSNIYIRVDQGDEPEDQGPQIIIR